MSMRSRKLIGAFALLACAGLAIILLPAGLLALCALLIEVRRRRGIAAVNKPQKAART